MNQPIELICTVTRVQRMPNTRNGVPRYRVELQTPAHHVPIVAVTRYEANYVYGVTWPYLEGEKVYVRLSTPRNNYILDCLVEIRELIIRAVNSRQLSPAALSMYPADTLRQHAEANAMTELEVVQEWRKPR